MGKLDGFFSKMKRIIKCKMEYRKQFQLYWMIGLAMLAGIIALSLWQCQRQMQTQETVKEDSSKQPYIKWVDFTVPASIMQKAYEYDKATYEETTPVSWISILAYLGAKYGGDFGLYKQSHMEEFVQKISNGQWKLDELEETMKYFTYYKEAYEAVLGGFVGTYKIQKEQTDGSLGWEQIYGLKAFHPIAKGFPYSEYEDFGASRSYGYKRNHLGHDLLGQVGTPIVAIESGYVYAIGWNQYGGWRIGINSFDGKRYYYYAHLRKGFPYAGWVKEGSMVHAGDVIGYMGRTGYSKTEDTNNIDVSHLHFGLQLIFDESQREGNNQIWIDPYALMQFLKQNQCQVIREDSTKEWTRVYEIKDEFGEASEETGESR